MSDKPAVGSTSPLLWIALGLALTLFIVGALALWLISSGGEDEDSFPPTPGALLDFSEAVAARGPSSCVVDGIQNDGSGDYDVSATITNESGERSAYKITYELVGPDGVSLGTDFGFINPVEPGLTVTASTLGIIDDPTPFEQVSCTVSMAERIPIN